MTDIGTVLGGRYRLVELLGQGGMATIYRARDAQLERDVAVKVLRPEYGADPDFLDRFRHEAQSAASLNHPVRRRRLRLRHGPGRAVHRHGARRGRGPRDDRPAQRGTAAARRGPARRAGGPRDRRGTRAWLRPSRHQARQHPRDPRGPGEGGRLRDRPRAVRIRADAARHDARLRPLLQPRAGARRARHARVGHLQPRHRPVRAPDRAPAVDRRHRGGDRDRPADRAPSRARRPSTAGSRRRLEAIDRKALATNAEDRFASAADMADALELFLGEERVSDGVRGRAAGAARGAGPPEPPERQGPPEQRPQAAQPRQAEPSWGRWSSGRRSRSR